VGSEVIDADRRNAAPGAPRPNNAVARMLARADAAAARGDYADALAWLRRVDATGSRLDPVYADRREEWRSKAETGRVGCSQWFG
jgi:hypothetical protein